MKEKKRRLPAAFLVFAIILMMAAIAGAEAPLTAIVPIDILTVNDFHGALAAADPNPGAAMLAGFLQAEKAKNPSGTIILSAGDMFQGSPDSNLLYGKTVVAVMNVMGFDAMALGNHEFDWGVPVLKDRIREAAFPFLAANISDKNTGRPVNIVKPYTMIERQGVKIGIIGIVTPETAITTNPKNVAAYSFTDPADTLKILIPQLKAQGAEIIVVLAHLASYNDEPASGITGEAADLAGNVPGIDVIVSGHSHCKVAGKVAGVPVVQAYYNGRAATNIKLVFSKTSREILGSTAKVVEIPGGNGISDLRVKDIILRSQAEIAPVKNLVLGSTVTALNHDRFELSPLGQWATDVMREAARADIALQNGGGLRAGIPAGKITAGVLYQVFPFDNTLYRVEMTGTQVLATLEHGIGNKKYGMLQFSGIRVQYNSSLPEGRRIVSVTLADGSELSPDKTYIIATNDFMVAGGDGFSAVKTAQSAADTYLSLRDVLAEAIKKIGRINFQGDGRLINLEDGSRRLPGAA